MTSIPNQPSSPPVDPPPTDLPRGFHHFDNATGYGAPLRSHDLEFDLEASTFVLRSSFAYVDTSEQVPYVVEAGLHTDLMSVPTLFRWLIERIGPSMPAVLLHDAHVVGLEPEPPDRPAVHWLLAAATAGLGVFAVFVLLAAGLPWWPAVLALAAMTVTTRIAAPLPNRPPVSSARTHRGPAIGRVDADRLFRRTLAETGTEPVQRWLIWDAVTLATLKDAPGQQPALRLRWWTLMGVSFLGVTVLGVLATLDLFDVVSVVPWMGEQRWWVEVLRGGAAAFAMPVVIALALWPRRLWPAFASGGVALAVLLHVSVAVALVLLGYKVLEAAAVRLEPVWAPILQRLRTASAVIGPD